MSNNKNMPTSPHIQIYKWSVTSLTSIMHRMTGIALYLSIIAICWFVTYYAYQIDGSQQSEQCDCLLKDILSYAFYGAIVALTFSLYYHFCNGVRHLFWDFGKGFEISTAKKTGLLSITCALVFTIATIGFALYLKIF